MAERWVRTSDNIQGVRCDACGRKTRKGSAVWEGEGPAKLDATGKGFLLLCYMCAIQLVAVAEGYRPASLVESAR